MFKDGAKSKHKIHEQIQAATMNVFILYLKHITQDVQMTKKKKKMQDRRLSFLLQLVIAVQHSAPKVVRSGLFL